MESGEESQVRARRRELAQAASARIKSENEADRAARNARRWKAERNPAEYEAQKERQRREYQPLGGGPVRPYVKITASTKTERAELAKARDAERHRGKYAVMPPEERQSVSDRKADRLWLERRRAKGVAEDILVAALAVRVQQREALRAAKAVDDADEAAMKSHQTYGMF
jgi:hypothetical protein